MTGFEIAAMTGADILPVLTLLEQSDLPTSGVRDSLHGFVVARSNALVVGVAALEQYGTSGLLRSVAVEVGHRGKGIGAALVQQIVDRAERDSLAALYLLTTTAAEYFERFGFASCPRGEAPDGIRQSWEFRTGCPSSAVLMRCRVKLL